MCIHEYYALHIQIKIEQQQKNVTLQEREKNQKQQFKGYFSVRSWYAKSWKHMYCHMKSLRRFTGMDCEVELNNLKQYYRQWSVLQVAIKSGGNQICA